MKKMRKAAAIVLAAVSAAVLMTGSVSAADKKQITVGSKQFTENILLGEIYAQLIEGKTDIKVKRKLNLGGTSVCQPAMQKGEIDMYFEYSGTAFNEILKAELTEGITADEIMEVCQNELDAQLKQTMFDPLGLNNTFAVAMKADRVSELGISSISDLGALSGDLKFAAGHVFYTRERDGYDTLCEVYGLKFKDSLKMDLSLLYDAIDAGQADVIIVYATDSLLKKYDLGILEDDQNVFPPYHGAPLVRNETLEAYPELSEVLNLLAGQIDDVKMQELNYEVDVNGRSVEEVAKEFLTENGYLA